MESYCSSSGQRYSHSLLEYVLVYGERRVKFKSYQLSVKWIGQAFGLSPETILLYTQEDEQLEVPDETGQFRLDSELVYTVQGDIRPPGSISTTSSTPDRPGPSGASEFPNLSTSLLPYGAIGMPYQTLPGPTAAKKKRFSLKSKVPELINSESSETWRKSIELHYYHKGSLIKGTNYPVTLNVTSSSILNDIDAKISAECYYGKDIVLLDNDNLLIPRNSCTQDALYWKGSRKIKAILKEEYDLLHGSTSNADSDDDDFMPLPCFGKGKSRKRAARSPVKSEHNARIKRLDVKLAHLEKQLCLLDKEEDKDSTSNLSRLLEDTKAKLNSLKDTIQEIKSNLSCFICASIINREITVLPCCKKMACLVCVSRWLGDNDTCPHCREDIISADLHNFPECSQIDSISSLMRQCDTSSPVVID